MIRVTRTSAAPASALIINLNLRPGPATADGEDTRPIEVQTIIALPATADGPAYSEVLSADIAALLQADPGTAQHFTFEDLRPAPPAVAAPEPEDGAMAVAPPRRARRTATDAAAD